jgi:hypothetical protein
VGVREKFCTFRKKQWVFGKSSALFKESSGCLGKVLQFSGKAVGVREKFFGFQKK